MSALTCTLHENTMRLKEQGNLTLHVFCILGGDDGYDLRMVMTMMTWWWPQATARSQAVWLLWFSTKRSAPWPTRNSTHLSIKRAVYGVSLCVQCSWCAKSELENGKPGLFRKKCKQDEPFKARLGGVMKSGVACHVPENKNPFYQSF